MSVPQNPSFGPIDDQFANKVRSQQLDLEKSLPPLDQHLKSLTIEKTRLGRIYDWRIGFIADDLERCIEQSKDPVFASFSFGSLVHFAAFEAVGTLLLTEAYAELPNRKRMIELVESVMAKEASNGT